MREPGSLTAGVPASVTSATRRPWASSATIFSPASRSLWRCAASGRACEPTRSSSTREVRVSSAATTSTPRSTPAARTPRSERCPIGVATTYNVPTSPLPHSSSVIRFAMPVRPPVPNDLFGALLGAAPPLPGLAQPETSAIGPESRGTASKERQTVGKGPIGVALLVPPDNGIYRRAAQALIAGVRAAQARDGDKVSLEIIEIDEDAAMLRALYDELKQRGFSLVIGPLTRSAVSLVAAGGPPPVFTLALNQPESGGVPANMVT